MITLEKIHKSFASQTLLENASLMIRQGEKVGLIGPNGAGKTTLLRIIEGLEELDAGQVNRQPHLRIGTLTQELIPSDRSIRQETLHGDRELVHLRAERHRIQQRLTDAVDHNDPEHRCLLARWGEVDHRLEEIGSYEAESRASTLLMGLGFDEEGLDQPLRAFSGGWRVRVALAQLLFSRPDILLLDEPTNHLDMESVAWFENHLRTMSQTFIAVSHDKGFLNRVTETTVELAHGTLSRFTGNFDAYIEQKALLIEQQEKQRVQQNRRIDALHRFIHRFRAKATKAKQVQSRVKQLQKLTPVTPLETTATVARMRLPEPGRSALKMLSADTLHKQFGAKIVLSGVTFTCHRGEKIGLLGPNGAGKTTLLKLLAGAMRPDQGTVRLGDRVQPAYFTQHAMETLNPDATLLEEAAAIAPTDVGTTTLRTLLGNFLFSQEDVFKQIRVLSGGERARVALVRMFLSGANLLLLDEPTNHLDMASRDALTDALESYQGALLLVTHDRDLMQAVCTRFLTVSGGHVSPMEEPLEAYLDRVTQARATPPPPPARQAPPNTSQEPPSTPVKKTVYERGKEIKRQRRRVETLENRIEQLENELAELEKNLADPKIYHDGCKKILKETQERNHTVEMELEETMHEWETLLSSLPA